MNTNNKESMASLTADIIVFRKNRAEILLIQRGHEPFAGLWAFPGGRMDKNEKLINTAYRELLEETNISEIELSFIDMADTPNRDSRGRTISFIYYGDIHNENNIKNGDDAINTQWFKISELPIMAFDHNKILERVIKKITL